MVFIDINSIKMNYKVQGEGYPVVLIHGLSDDLNYWNPLSSYLSKYFKVISMDLRGHGKTSIGNDQLSISLLCNDVYKLIQSLHIKKCCLVGFSIGGNIAIELALNHPEVVSSLILMSTFAKADDELTSCFLKFKKGLDSGFECFCDEIIPYVLPKELIEENKDKLKDIKKEKAKYINTENIKKIIIAEENFNRLNDLKNINCKTLIIVGKNDTLTCPKFSYELKKNIPNSKIELIDYGKHNLYIKQNIAQLNKIILEFLKDEKR